MNPGPFLPALLGTLLPLFVSTGLTWAQSTTPANREFARKRADATAGSIKELKELAKTAREKGAFRAAAEAEGLARALGPDEGLEIGPGDSGDEKEEKAFAAQVSAARARALTRFAKLREWCIARNLWREQARLAEPLTAIGVDDPKARQALGMRECKAVGWCWVIRTPHYEIITNLPPDTQLEVVEAAEDTYEAFTTFFRPHARLREPKSRFVMYYFDTREQFLDYCGAVGKTALTAYGFYDPGDGQCYFRKDVSLFGLCGIIYHEGVHQLHDKILGKQHDTPAWVTEGLASYFETLERKDGKLVLGSGGRTSIWHLSNARYIPLERFVDIPQEDWVGIPRKFGLPNLSPQYGQAALLTRYFLEAEDGKFKDRFIRDLLLKSGGRAQDLEKVLGLRVKDLVPRYVEFANRYFKSPISESP